MARQKKPIEQRRVKLNLTIHPDLREWADEISLKRRRSISQLFEDLVEMEAPATIPLPRPTPASASAATLLPDAALSVSIPGTPGPESLRSIKMGLLSALLGNASEVDTSKLEKEFADLLIDGESIQHAYKLFRDLIVFTNYRLFLVDKQGMTGKKRQYTSIPYKSIDYFSKETAGHFDLDAEINIWIKSRKEPIVLEFRKDTHIHDVFKVLSHYALAS